MFGNYRSQQPVFIWTEEHEKHKGDDLISYYLDDGTVYKEEYYYNGELTKCDGSCE